MSVNILYQDEKFQWIDILDLKKEEIPAISEQYGINHFLLEDCIDPNHLPKFEELEDLQFILARQNTSTERLNLNTIADISTKIGIFIKKDFIITVHRIENDGIKKIVENLKQNKIKNLSPYKIALELGLKIFNSFEDENQMLLEQMDKMENEIFMKNVSSSTQIKRLYRFKRKVGLNLKVLNLSNEWVNSTDRLPLDSVEIKDLKDSYKDAVSDFDHLSVQSTNMINLFLALSDQKNNEAMKMLSTYSIYFLPITFIAGVYGMNFEFMPELKKTYGYYATLGVMLLIVILTFIYIRRKRW